MDRQAFLLVAGVTLIPTLLYMLVEGVIGSAFHWLMFVSLGGGVMIVYVAGQVEEKEASHVLTIVGGTMIAIGVVASALG